MCYDSIELGLRPCASLVNSQPQPTTQPPIMLCVKPKAFEAQFIINRIRFEIFHRY